MGVPAVSWSRHCALVCAWCMVSLSTAARGEWAAFESAVGALNAARANYTLAFGSVLAWHRDGELANDDIDFTVSLDWLRNNHWALHHALRIRGWRRTRTLGVFGATGYEESWRRHATKVDLFTLDSHNVFGLTVSGTTYACSVNMTDARWHVWKGVRFLAPSPLREYLDGTYGTTWQQPDATWKWDLSPFRTDNGQTSCTRKVLLRSTREFEAAKTVAVVAIVLATACALRVGMARSQGTLSPAWSH